MNLIKEINKEILLKINELAKQKYSNYDINVVMKNNKFVIETTDMNFIYLIFGDIGNPPNLADREL